MKPSEVVLSKGLPDEKFRATLANKRRSLHGVRFDVGRWIPRLPVRGRGKPAPVVLLLVKKSVCLLPSLLRDHRTVCWSM